MSQQNPALSAAAALLSHTPRSRGALINRLLEKGFAPADSAAAADRLEHLGLLNDLSLACALTESYANRGYGPFYVKGALQQKLFEPQVIEEALEGYTQSDEKLQKYIDSKVKGRQIDRKVLKKVTDGLFRRGFGWEEIDHAIGQYTSALEDETID